FLPVEPFRLPASWDRVRELAPSPRAAAPALPPHAAAGASAGRGPRASGQAGGVGGYRTWGLGAVRAASAVVAGGRAALVRAAVARAIAYMALEPGTPIQEIAVDRVFIGSCTNSRIEDLRSAAAIVRGRHVHPSVRAMVVPGSAQVKQQAEAEGLDRIFTDA